MSTLQLSDVIDALPDRAGAIGLVSSEEFTPEVEAFDRAFMSVAGVRIGIVLAADPDGAQEAGARALAHYRALGGEPMVIHVLRREHAEAAALPECDLLFLAGGDPSNLLRALRDTPFWDAALEAWRKGMALAGASAGAMAMCRDCLVPRVGDDKPTMWDRGLGPLERFGLAVHAATRPEEWLRRVAAGAPVQVVAVDDATGVLIRHGAPPKVIGPGRAWVVPAL